MFGVSGGCGCHGLLPGIAMGRAGGQARGQGRAASTSRAEAARRLESLTPAEVRALSSHSAQVLGRLISQPLDTSSPTWEALFSTAVTAITSPSKMNSPSRPLFCNSIGHTSPLLVQARGFKSRARGGTE